MGRLIPLWDELRSYLGIVALLAIGLPAVVLVLTLLADSSRPLPTQASDGDVGRGEVAHRQDHPEGLRPGGNGTGSVRPLGRHGKTGSPEGGSEADIAGSTRQPVRADHTSAHREQDPPSASDAPATSTATAAAPAPTPAAPTPVGPSTPPVATAAAPTTAPVTTSAPAPTPMATASPEAAPAPESSPPAISVPISEPVEVPVDGVQGLVSDPQLRGPSK